MSEQTGIRKSKAQVELNLDRHIKGNNNFFRCISDKRKARGGVGSLQKENGDLVMRDVKADALNDFFASGFTSKVSSYNLHAPESKGRDWEKEILSNVTEDPV